jgi:hypothetical protein
MRSRSVRALQASCMGLRRQKNGAIGMTALQSRS